MIVKPIDQMGDQALIAEHQTLYGAVHVEERYSVMDMVRLNVLEEELFRRGYYTIGMPPTWLRNT